MFTGFIYSSIKGKECGKYPNNHLNFLEFIYNNVDAQGALFLFDLNILKYHRKSNILVCKSMDLTKVKLIKQSFI